MSVAELALARLTNLGFRAEVSSRIGGVLIKMRTSKGWIYQKIDADEDTILGAVNAFAAKYEPE